MNYVTQAQLNALAAMANVTLLPVVKAAQTAGLWDDQNIWYDKTTGGPTQILGLKGSFGTLVNPQPDYSFDANTLFNLIPANAVYDATGNYNVTIPTSTEYNYIQGENDITMNDPSGSQFSYFWSVNNVFLAVGTIINFQGNPNSPVTATFTRSPYNLLHEMNRMRGDLMAMYFESFAVTGGNLLFQNPAVICSGPWVVGVSDPTTWKLVGTEWEGCLDGLVNGCCIFNNVAFDFAANDAGSLTVNGYLQNGNSSQQVALNRQNATLPGSSSPSFNLITDQAGTLNLVYFFPLAGIVPPDTSGFTLSATPSTGVTWSIGTTVDFNGSPCGALVATISRAITAGTTNQVLNMACPSGTSINGVSPGGGISFWKEIYYASINFVTASTLTTVAGIHPTSAVKQVTCAESGGNHSIFTLQDLNVTYPTMNLITRIFWKLSNLALKGVWIAKTIPVPGINVYLDQDFPPYIGSIEAIRISGSLTDIAVAGNNEMDGTTDAPLASSMRQAAPITLGVPDITVIKGVKSVKPSITTRPAKWLVRRDTDFMPFDFGFSSFGNYIPTTYINQFVSPTGTPGQISFYNVAVPPTATKVLIRLMKTGTVPGWKSGVFEFGDPVGTELDILVKQSTFPSLPSNYDFKKTDGTVTIDGTGGSDGGAGYLASVQGNGFSFAVVNPGTTSQGFDAYVEIDTGTVSRVYIPPVGECFSYCLDGTTGAYFGIQSSSRINVLNSKPIPQNGYCIFKVRVTRLPVDNGNGIQITPAGGTALTITIGQNILSAGVMTFTPFVVNSANLTVTIPVTSGTSDDVAVFIPVLSGNELVYKCIEQVIFEAWVNWQPIFFNQMYGRGEFPYDLSTAESQTTPPLPTAFQYALSFANDFNVKTVGWVSPVNSTNPTNPNYRAANSAVVFPLFFELFSNLVALMVAMGGTYGGIPNSGGAGGSGATGNNTGAGDATGGGFPAL